MKRRTKIATILTAGLLSASLVGVGFAAWTVTGGTHEESATGGNLHVDTVNDGTVGVESFSAKVTTGDIYFSIKKEDKDSQTGWLTNDEQTNFESLEGEISITISSKNIKQITIAFEPPTEWSTALSGGYVAAPVFSLTEDTNYELQGGNKIVVKGLGTAQDKATLTLKVTFDWGTYFDGENPYTLFKLTDYNAQMKSAFTGGNHDAIGTSGNETIVGEYAKKGLDEIAKLDGKSFSVKLTASATVS